MSKSVLVIDTPKHCRECLLCDSIMNSKNEYKHLCSMMFDTGKGDVIQRFVNPEDPVPDWCPLIPLPQKRDSSHYIHRGDAKSMIHTMIIMQDTGYNQCLDDLQKGVTK